MSPLGCLCAGRLALSSRWKSGPGKSERTPGSECCGVAGDGGREACTSPLWTATIAELQGLIVDGGPSRPVFLNRCGQPITRFGIHAAIERYALEGVAKMPAPATKRVSPHSIRHTTATHLLRAGVDINTVRGWLGRVSLDTTNVYAEIDFETKAKALEKCEAPDMGKVPKRWPDQPALMDFLRSL